ncbi:hypothetical protein NDU88_004480 [Pleurodeles waltl]|uniref:Uncharacterized protein n=1 Tax=Pleurodeles waltl TaxID=8319 RepID=A0AAV7V198_PLEWA|nr:hypothetical protein NDU88_004480 [Pleurodeles waltl]
MVPRPACRCLLKRAHTLTDLCARSLMLVSPAPPLTGRGCVRRPFVPRGSGRLRPARMRPLRAEASRTTCSLVAGPQLLPTKPQAWGLTWNSS